MLVWSLGWGVGEGTSHGPMSSVRADPRWAGLCPVKTEKKKKRISVEPGNNKVWLQSQHGGHGRRKNRRRC